MTAEIGILIGVVLALAVVILVTRPLRAPTIATRDDDSQLSDLLARREAAYQVLRDLDTDFAQGKMNEDDYRPMRVQALAQAAEIVAQLDTATTKSQMPKGTVPAPNPKLQTENPKPEVQRSVTNDQRRMTKTKKVQRAIRNSPSFDNASSPSGDMDRLANRNSSCPSCGAAHEPNDAFCRKCGKALQA
jgi:hypothetical protein